jgi:hypothetical protein
MKEIPLTKGKVAVIDDEDYERVAALKWTYGGGGYAHRRGNVYLHRFILGEVPDGMVVDHINRDKLDNRRANLRITTQSVNVFNTPLRKDNKSGVKGICWNKQYRRWQVEAKLNKERFPLGYFVDLKDAIAARAAFDMRVGL